MPTFLVMLCLLVPFATTIQDDKKPAAIAATVGASQISVASVERFLNQRLGKKKLSDTAVAIARKHALEHLVDRALIHQHLVSKERWVDGAVVRLEIEKLKAELARADVTLETHLAKKNISHDQFVFEVEWRLGWQKYLDETLTDDRLKQYFESKRREFDGTSMKVAHLLIKDQSDKVRDQLNEIRGRLLSNPESWNELVAKHSQAASKDDGGVIGWIEWDGPMPPTFVKTAFALEPNEISEPLKSKFGYHLIKCMEIQPGKKGVLDAREEVIASAQKFLFERLSREGRSKFKIEYNESD